MVYNLNETNEIISLYERLTVYIITIYRIFEGDIMFEAYSCNIDMTDLIKSDVTFDDSFDEIFHETLSSFDKFIYFIQLYKIILSCAEDFISFKVHKKDEFWKTNKYLLNYVNSVYCYKEYAENGYDNPVVKNIVNKYYIQNKWFAFLCNYRNRIIHQSVLIKDYDWNTGDVYINLDELILYQTAQLKVDESKNRNCRKALEFMERIKQEAYDNKGTYYLSAQKVIENVNYEIEKMSEELFIYLYDNEIKEGYKWLFSVVLKNGKEYLNTVVAPVNSIEGLNPTFLIEDYFVNTIVTIGEKFSVVKEMKRLFDEVGYNYLFNYAQTVDELLENIRLKNM